MLYQNKKAFTLTELMVVIAIVAIIAAIAVPAYKNYILKANFLKSAAVIDSVLDKTIEYASINGHYPDSYYLGLSTTPNSGWADNDIADAIMPYMLPYSRNGFMLIGGDPCGSDGYLKVTLDPVKLGFDAVQVNSSNGDNAIYAEVYFWHTNGIFYKNYQYHYCLQSTSGNYSCGNDNIFSYPWHSTGASYNAPYITDANLLNSYNNRSCI